MYRIRHDAFHPRQDLSCTIVIVRERRTPFEIAAPCDTFHEETNMCRLRTAVAERFCAVEHDTTIEIYLQQITSFFLFARGDFQGYL